MQLRTLVLYAINYLYAILATKGGWWYTVYDSTLCKNALENIISEKY